MLQLEVRRNPQAVCTPGELYVVSDEGTEGFPYQKRVFVCYTLEPAQTNPDHPSIPNGDYRLIISWSPHFKRNVPHLLDVPGRLYIEIHPGNKVMDTEGCLLVGKSFDTNTNALYDSKAAFDYLMDILLADSGDKKFMIQYLDEDHGAASGPTLVRT